MAKSPLTYTLCVTQRRSGVLWTASVTAWAVDDAGVYASLWHRTLPLELTRAATPGETLAALANALTAAVAAGGTVTGG
jgi:hypothetical protein